MKKIYTLLIYILIIATLLCACGGEKKSLSEIYDEIKTVASLPAMTTAEEDYIESYYDLDISAFSDYVFETAEDALLVDTVIILTCKDASETENVKEKLETILKQIKLETESYSPENYAIAKKSSVTVKGDTVYLVITDKYSDAVKVINKGI